MLGEMMIYESVPVQEMQLTFHDSDKSYNHSSLLPPIHILVGVKLCNRFRKLNVTSLLR